jgi:hypothetical protein
MQAGSGTYAMGEPTAQAPTGEQKRTSGSLACVAMFPEEQVARRNRLLEPSCHRGVAFKALVEEQGGFHVF